VRLRVSTFHVPTDKLALRSMRAVLLHGFSIVVQAVVGAQLSLGKIEDTPVISSGEVDIPVDICLGGTAKSTILI